MAAEKLAADSVTLASAAAAPRLFTCLQRGLGCVSILVRVPQTRAPGAAGTPHFSGSGRVIPQARTDRKLRQPGAARGRPTSGPSRSVPVLYRGYVTVRTHLPGCREGKGVPWGRGGSRGEPQGCHASVRATRRRALPPPPSTCPSGGCHSGRGHSRPALGTARGQGPTAQGEKGIWGNGSDSRATVSLETGTHGFQPLASGRHRGRRRERDLA